MRVLLLIMAFGTATSAPAQFAPVPRVPAPSSLPPFVAPVGPTQAGPWRDLHDVRERIARGRDAGQLSRREARGLRRQARYVDGLTGRYAADGLSDAERRELDVRTRVLRDETAARRSGARRP